MDHDEIVHWITTALQQAGMDASVTKSSTKARTVYLLKVKNTFVEEGQAEEIVFRAEVKG